MVKNHQQSASHMNTRFEGHLTKKDVQNFNTDL
jgi:hypothetical protein